MVICGIDPGVKGAICFIDGSLVSVYKMPREVHQVQYILNLFDCAFFVESVHSSPKMGPSNAFTFGQRFGQLEGILCKKNVTYVPPQNWQRAMACMSGGDKKITHARAKELFVGLRGLTKDTADACLIAYYGWMKHGRK
jgi:hypothetical protein